MELRHLATLVKIAELGSFSAAARELGYTQSTVTMQMQALERDLDAPLFDRIGRSVHLTENGRVAVLAARKMLEEARRLRLTLAEGDGGLVRIGVYESLCGAFLQAQQNVGGGIQNFRQFGYGLGVRGGTAGFPFADSLLGDAQHPGNFSLAVLFGFAGLF